MRVEVDSLSFAYGDEKVIEDASFETGKGDITAILGPNGSGKSTLANCVCGLEAPERGSIRIGGREISEMSRKETARKIGFVPQKEEKSFPKTVFNRVLTGRKPYFKFRPGERDFRKVKRVLKKLGLHEISEKRMSEISGGQRQKVLIARALVQEPDLLILDEPTNNLDLNHQLEVLEILRDKAEQGVSVIIVLHDLNLALRLADRFVVMKNGRIIDSGGSEVLSENMISDVYSIDVSMRRHNEIDLIIPKSSRRK